MQKIKRIGVLTSGGDAPGMNAAIRGVVRTAIYNGIEVVGICNGYKGLIDKHFIDMDARIVGETLQKGGTILMTARCKEFVNPEVVARGVQNAKEIGLDGLVVIGGDGSFRGARDLTRAGLPSIGIPGTIDNDIDCSEYTIGYDTCLNTVIEAVDKLRDTSSSHHRCSVVEVMGRGAGYIAVEAGIACGAEVVLIPEIPYDLQTDVIDVIEAGKRRGKRHYIIIVAEGVGGSIELAKKVKEITGIDSRATILGHIQRGGSPSVRDRVVASQMGAYATELLIAGKANRIVCIRDGKLADVDIEEGLKMEKHISEDLIKLVKQLSI